MSTTYAPATAGRNIGHVFLEKNQRLARSECFQPIQIFRVRNWCCWAPRRTPLVGASEPWCANGPGVIVGKKSTPHYCAFLTAIITKVLPLTIPLTYFFLLPQPSVSNHDEEGDGTELLVASSTEYTPLPTDENESTTVEYRRSRRTVALSAGDKWRLVKPMIPKYMLPLCEYLSRL